MHKNNKGQSLIEFVLILPVFLMIIFVLIDFSRILYEKNHLEGVLNDCIYMKKNDKSEKNILDTISKNNKNIRISFNKADNLYTISLYQKIKLVTPFAKNFIKDPYEISTKRVLIYE